MSFAFILRNCFMVVSQKGWFYSSKAKEKERKLIGRFEPASSQSRAQCAWPLSYTGSLESTSYPYSPPGLSPINKNPNSEKFSDKNLRILNPPIFSENLRNFQTKYFGAAGWTNFWKFSSEYFDRNTIWKSEEIFRILRIFLLIGLKVLQLTITCLITCLSLLIWELCLRRLWE